jgi:RhtB (resistance to homoserine/threonine) family protein
MVDFVPLLHVAPLFMAALISPGPDFMMVSSLALSRGRATGCWAAAGIVTGILFFTSLCLWGLGLIFEQHPLLTVGVKIGGGAYLTYLGIVLLRAARQAAGVPTDDQACCVALPKGHAYRTGLMTSLTNPKGMAFFASVFAMAIRSDTASSTKAVTALGCALMAALWFMLVATLLAHPTLRTRLRKAKNGIDTAVGLILVLFGLHLALGTLFAEIYSRFKYSADHII